MSNDIVQYDELEKLGKALVASDYFRGDVSKISQAMVKVLAGREMGFGPIASMTGIHVIKGRPAVGANLMAAAVKSHAAYDYRVRTITDDLCEVEFFQDGQSLGVSSFSAQDAKKAGTKNMGQFPRNMLFARAISNGVRWFCPDVFVGNTVYTPEELGEGVDDGYQVVDAEFVEDTDAGTDVVERAVEELGAQPQPPAPSDKPAAEIMADNDRPYGVADVLAILEQRVDAFTVTLEDSEPDDNDRRVGLFVSMLGRCFDGDSDKRHVATWGMFGVKDGSAKSVTRAQVRAWLNEYVTRDEDGGYVLQPYAKAEMNAVYTTALEATGQGVMEL